MEENFAFLSLKNIREQYKMSTTEPRGGGWRPSSTSPKSATGHPSETCNVDPLLLVHYNMPFQYNHTQASLYQQRYLPPVHFGRIYCKLTLCVDTRPNECNCETTGSNRHIFRHAVNFLSDCVSLCVCNKN